MSYDPAAWDALEAEAQARLDQAAKDIKAQHAAGDAECRRLFGLTREEADARIARALAGPPCTRENLAKVARLFPGVIVAPEPAREVAS